MPDNNPSTLSLTLDAVDPAVSRTDRMLANWDHLRAIIATGKVLAYSVVLVEECDDADGVDVIAEYGCSEHESDILVDALDTIVQSIECTECTCAEDGTVFEVMERVPPATCH
jgi:hypothetical protein